MSKQSDWMPARRSDQILVFEYGDSGKTAHFCVQIENDGKKGPRGPISSAVIP